MNILPESDFFLPLRELAGKLGQWPDCADLSMLASERSICNAKGLPVSFVEDRGKDYEERIYLRGEVQTRSSSWHDLFNAFVWMSFPKAKAHLNAVHFHEMAIQAGKNRGEMRDIATLFDESGVIVASSDESLSNMLRNFEWKRLFWEHRESVRNGMRFYVFGHGLYEKGLAPFVGLTGHGLIFPVGHSFFGFPPEKQRFLLDESFATRYSKIRATRDFSPVPVLGYPGWTRENDLEAYYENERYFRRGRSGIRGIQ